MPQIKCPDLGLVQIQPFFFVSTLWKMEIMKIVLGGFWNNAVLALLMIYTLIILGATFDSGFKSD